MSQKFCIPHEYWVRGVTWGHVTRCHTMSHLKCKIAILSHSLFLKRKNEKKKQKIIFLQILAICTKMEEKVRKKDVAKTKKNDFKLRNKKTMSIEEFADFMETTAGNPNF